MVQTICKPRSILASMEKQKSRNKIHFQESKNENEFLQYFQDFQDYKFKDITRNFNRITRFMAQMICKPQSTLAPIENRES